MSTVPGWTRPLVTAVGLVAAWWMLKVAAAIPDYLLPDPLAVLRAGWANRALLGRSAAVTAAETALGLLIGTGLGAGFALSMVFSRSVERWLMPVLILSQAIPVFALA
ncbi:MAG: ABC transporter permease, partial [Gluconacetobacter diazotrophicus]|nr:ABC transporter permease [Gluconacetobacter diazotrophicus]